MSKYLSQVGATLGARVTVGEGADWDIGTVVEVVGLAHVRVHWDVAQEVYLENTLTLHIATPADETRANTPTEVTGGRLLDEELVGEPATPEQKANWRKRAEEKKL